MKVSSGTEGQGLSRFPDRLRRARRLASISQAALAHAVGISPSAVAQWEQENGTQPGVAHLVSVARITGTSIEWLITGAGRPRAMEPVDETSALSADAYARDASEEILLREYRALGLRARRIVIELVGELGVAKGRKR
ncbi:MAG: helix-turn-helix transcriptional regulator [Xanthomonadales bacterium]|nr:helix-turn-helix transcriptional regulator [Xanthomonadales bacterium]